MQIEFTVTKADFVNLYNSKSIQKLTKNLTVVIVICIVIVCVAGGTPFNWLKAIASLFILPFFWCVLYLINYCVLSNHFRKTTPTNILTTNDEGLQITNRSGAIVKIFKWNTIVSIDSTEKLIYLTFFDKKVLIIPKRDFLSDLEKANFITEIESHVDKNGGWLKPQFVNNPTPPYWMGYLCLIPLVGAVIGIILIADGISKYKNKWLIIMGAGGVVFTGTLCFLVYYFFLSAFFSQQMVPMAQKELNTLTKEVEFYKLQHGVYPDSLKQAAKDDAFYSFDPTQSNNGKPVGYHYKKVGNKYYLFSSGVDGIPNTNDDIYPQMSIADTSKFGLILK